MSRRLMLTLGGAMLLGACDASHVDGAESLWPQDIRGDSRPSHIRRRVTPPQVCPTYPGVNEKPGGPQHVFACHANDIALTIDDGPDPEWTPQVLALLAKHNIRATFFLISNSARRFPKLVAAIADHGHEIANHTVNHPMPFNRLSDAAIRSQINRCNDVLTQLTGRRPRLFRAPGGAWSKLVLAECAAAGLQPLDWTVDPRDWSKPGVNHIVNTWLGQTKPGSILLSHDGGGNRLQTVQALTIALPRLIDSGYTFAVPGETPRAPATNRWDKGDAGPGA